MLTYYLLLQRLLPMEENKFISSLMKVKIQNLLKRLEENN